MVVLVKKHLKILKLFHKSIRMGSMANLSDIAKKANVSQAAASRVLNQDPTFVVSKEVRLAIKKAAAELNFEAAAEYRDQMISLKKMLQEEDR